MAIPKDNIQRVLVYTMTAGLGDYLVMRDVMQKAETFISDTRCFMVHRANPHPGLGDTNWDNDRFFNFYHPEDMLRLISRLRALRRKGVEVFGLQMAPGSWQGYLLHSVLRKLGALDYIVDFNLINADIVTPPSGGYILEQHLEQLSLLFGKTIPQEAHRLRLPFEQPQPSCSEHNRIGIHPWSRRSRYDCFVWPWANWKAVVHSLLELPDTDVVIIGKDKELNAFFSYLQNDLPLECQKRLSTRPAVNIPEFALSIGELDILLSVNTGAIHIGYACGIKMVVLSGPSLNLWTPQGPGITVIQDPEAVWPGSDRKIKDSRAPTVQRILPDRVIEAVKNLLSSRNSK